MSKSGRVKLEFGGHPLRVEYDYSPAIPGIHTLRNGDPGWPDEPEEFCVTKVELNHAGVWIDISDFCADLVGDLGGDDPLSVAVYAAMPQPEYGPDVEY